jgi:mRNA interferase RelE/StbE
MFEIYLSNMSLKALKRLDKGLVEQIRTLLLNLETSPLPIKGYDVRKIRGAEDIYRVRISEYRIVYKIEWEIREINVIKITERDENTYKRL